MTTVSLAFPQRAYANADDPVVPQPLPTHGDDTSTPGTSAPDPNGNWVLGTDYTDQKDAHSRHTVAWHVGTMIGAGVVGGTAGWFAGYGVAKLRGVNMNDTSGYMSSAALTHVTLGTLALMGAGIAGGFFIASAVNDHLNPTTATYPERTLVTGYTDTRLPMVLESGLKVADVQGADRTGGKSGTMQVFTSGAPEKFGSDREAAITEARNRVLHGSLDYKDDTGSEKVYNHEAMAVLQTAGGEYYLAKVKTEQSKDVGQRFDTYQVRSTDPALVALVTPSALYRA